MTVPSSVLDAYEFEASEVRPLAGGLINETFVVGDARAPRAVLQKLHPVFDPEVNLDIDAITAHIAAAGMETPRMIRTNTGALWLDRWRAMTFIPGQSFDFVQSETQAQSAAALIGRFHAAVDGWDYQFCFARKGVHDTPAHLERLRHHVEAQVESLPGALTLAEGILGEASSLDEWPSLSERICHGDLKISNIRFSPEDPERAVCLLDLDTFGRSTLAYELGDAMRSWCNRAPEDAPPRFDLDIFAAAIRGYRTTMPESVTPPELESVAAGTIVVCLELAARFCSDVFDDNYFGWDASRYPSRPAHNLARASSMLALARLVAERKEQLTKLVQTAWI